MKKSYKVTGIDCPNCAAKLEEKLRKVEGVEKLTLNFMTERMTLEAADDKFADILSKVVDVQKEHEPEWEIHVK